MINPHSVNEARVILKRPLTELQLQAVSKTLRSPTEQTGESPGECCRVRAGGCWLPSSTAPHSQSHGRASVQRLGNNKRLRNGTFYIQNLLFDFFPPTGVSGSSINQAWHKEKCVPIKTQLKFCLSEPSTSCGYKTCCCF